MTMTFTYWKPEGILAHTHGKGYFKRKKSEGSDLCLILCVCATFSFVCFVEELLFKKKFSEIRIRRIDLERGGFFAVD